MSDLTFAESIDRMKESLLSAAAQKGHSQDCQSLIEIGADINWKNENGDTPLILACRHGHIETIDVLLSYSSCDPNICSIDTLTPLHICTRRNDIESVNMLLERAVNLDTTIRTKDGLTALDIATSKEYKSIYTRIMTKGSSVSSNNDYSSATIITTRYDNIDRKSESKKRQTLSTMIQNATMIDNNLETNIALSSTTTITNNNHIFPEIKNNLKASNVNYFTFENNTIPTIIDTNNNRNNNNNNITQYSIMGSSIDYKKDCKQGDETATIALRKLLDQEQATRKTLEMKLDIFKNQNTQLLQEYSIISHQLTEVQEELSITDFNYRRIQGDNCTLDNITIEECEELEKKLKHAIEVIESKKTSLIKDTIGNQKEQRLCVICQENEKSVVLLPCRHLCLCDHCSLYDQLTMCPLCRQIIAHKISVFA